MAAIQAKMTEMVADCRDHWDPGLKLEFLKMCLRTTVGEVNNGKKMS